jgi:alpha/beta superfamily hydrolase
VCSHRWVGDSSVPAENVQPVTFPAADDGPLLEGALHLSAGPGPSPAAIVCHPHPLMGGTMDNTIVVAVCRALVARDWIALRFNFRGAGRSAGTFDGGRGEMDDVSGALGFLARRSEVDKGQLAVVGYSFGAEVGLHQAAQDTRVGWLVGIALVQEHYADPFLDADTRPKLFIAGERDLWAPADQLHDYVARLSPPNKLHLIPHTDHFFFGREADVAALVTDFLSPPQPLPPSVTR